MRPSQLKSLKALFEGISAELASARKTAEERCATVTHQQIEQQKANQEEWEKTQEVLARPRRTDPNEQAASEASQERRHRQNLRMQGILVLGTWLAFAAAAIYAGIAKGQLDQMKIATEQTKRAADLAACALRQNQEQFHETLTEIQKQTTAQVKSSDAAKNAAVTASQQLEVEDRPWVSVDVSAYQADPGTGLSFDAKGKGHMLIKTTMKNIGHMVASNVSLRIEARAISILGNPFNEPKRWQHDLCSVPDKSKVVRYTIFPNGPPAEEAEDLGFETKDIPNTMPELKRGKPVMVFVYGCAEYEYLSSAVKHQTGFAYQVYGSQTTFQGIQVGINVPRENVRLWPHEFGGKYAY